MKKKIFLIFFIPQLIQNENLSQISRESYLLNTKIGGQNSLIPYVSKEYIFIFSIVSLHLLLIFRQIYIEHFIFLTKQLPCFSVIQGSIFFFIEDNSSIPRINSDLKVQLSSVYGRGMRNLPFKLQQIFSWSPKKHIDCHRYPDGMFTLFLLTDSGWMYFLDRHLQLIWLGVIFIWINCLDLLKVYIADGSLSIQLYM